MRVEIPELAGVQVPIPSEFRRLYDVATNLWWIWDEHARDVWSYIDPRRWSDSPNPIGLLQGTDAQTWEALSADPKFLDLYQAVVSRFDEYMTNSETWWEKEYGSIDGPIAYLCAEFGLHHKLPFYSGGLGVLAGDHLKTASDLGIPMVAVGLLYRRGYFRQAVDPGGDQQHYYPTVEIGRRPIHPVKGSGGGQLTVDLEFPGRTVHVAAWRMQVGRIPLIMLDTDIPQNHPADRPITHLLYVRGRDMRLAQELVLGTAAVKVLRALDINPAVWHVNEGHAAFSLLERAHEKVKGGMEVDEAVLQIKESTLFTLHTPVPAGNEKFESGAVSRYTDYLFPGLESATVRDLGRVGDHDDGMFDMGATAIRFSSFVNGVSRRHGEVATHQWSHLTGDRVSHVTNGVHVPTWVGHSIARLYSRHVATGWPDQLTNPTVWKKVHEIPSADLWQAHTAQKLAMIKQMRRRMAAQVARHGGGPDVLREINDFLPPDRFTIGFARRFATYKRATLILHDLPRLQALLTNPDRPVQLLFAGKAHPADDPGQGLIRRVVELSRWPEFKGHIFFVEDYNMLLGELLTGGCDIWLNNPVPPKEASGTSGMKAAINGVPNVSVPDGWWEEVAADGKNGWIFGPPGLDPHPDHDDAASLYAKLENDVVPLYYDRNDKGVPEGWVEVMKSSIADTVHQFSSHRMLMEYTRDAYAPLAERAKRKTAP